MDLCVNWKYLRTERIYAYEWWWWWWYSSCIPTFIIPDTISQWNMVQLNHSNVSVCFLIHSVFILWLVLFVQTSSRLMAHLPTDMILNTKMMAKEMERIPCVNNWKARTKRTKIIRKRKLITICISQTVYL